MQRIIYKIKIKRNSTKHKTDTGVEFETTNYHVVTIDDGYKTISRRIDNKTELMKFLRENVLVI